MKTSTEISSASKIVGEQRAVEMIAKAGFDCWDFSMFSMGRYDWNNLCIIRTDHPLMGSEYLKFAKELRHIGEENGISCNQAHAPFPIFCKEIYDMQKRAIECAAVAGAKVIVIHPDNNKNAEQNAEIFATLLPFAKDHGVTIATENMWNWNNDADRAAPAACSHPADFLRHVEIMNDKNFAACVDIGHAEMFGDEVSAAEMIRTLGSHVAALHIHDNDRHHDSHDLPFLLNIDFDPIVRALKDVGYKGEFTLEADAYLSRHFKDGDTFTGICNMAKAARKLADAFEAL